jgi:hypothetical protein
MHFSFILLLALSAVVDLHVKLRRTTMIVEEHEKPLMQLMVLCKLGLAAPEVHLTTAIVVHFNLIWCSSSRFFTKDSFTKLAPVHELGKLQRNTLLLTTLSTRNNEERESFDKRRRRGIARSSACTLGNNDRWFGLVLTSQGAAGAPLHGCRRRQGHQGGVLRFILTAAWMAAPLFLHQGTGVKVDNIGIRHWKVVLGKKKP